MLRTRTILAVIALLTASAAFAVDPTAALLAKAWPDDPSSHLSTLGRGVGVVFSPDLSVPGNCRFYESLGFGCFQDADWYRVLYQIRTYNINHPANPVRTLVLETHGTNGNGLKLQTSYDPSAGRSYISVGALQERLEPDGIRYIIISACNSGRLLRPSIYRTIDRNNGDKLFLPATYGIIDADPDFDPSRSSVTIVTPLSSHIETSLAANVSELSPAARRLIAAAARAQKIKPPREFAVSDMMMKIVLRDPSLSMTTDGYVDVLSRDMPAQDVDEALFAAFKAHLDALAAREAPIIARATPAHKPPKRTPQRPAGTR